MNKLKLTANRYFDYWKQKDLKMLESILSENIQFIGAMSCSEGVEAYIAGANQTFPLIESMNLKAEFYNGDEAVLIYDFNCINPIGKTRVAELLTISDDKVKRSELFFDARPFEKFFSHG